VVADILGRALSLDDPDDLAALSAFVRAWEPGLEPFRPPLDSLFYEPDGTTYAIALTPTMEVPRDHPRRSVGTGDLLVIPREYALDLGPQVDLLAIRHEGPPPDHFRERFIQVWGFEHFPAPPTTGAPAYHDVVPASEVRFRVLYAILDVSHGDTHELEASEALRLCVMLDGQVAVACSGVKFDSSSRQAFLLPAGAGCRLRGTGRLGVLILHHELSHDARRQAASRLDSSPLSPERAPSMTSGSPFAEIE
jgi:hypothetical protein